MTCMNDYETIYFKCGYEPCGHEGELRFHKYDMDRYGVKQCPVCKVWNYTCGRPEMQITPELHEALTKAMREGSALICKGRLVKDS